MFVCFFWALSSESKLYLTGWGHVGRLRAFETSQVHTIRLRAFEVSWDYVGRLHALGQVKAMLAGRLRVLEQVETMLANYVPLRQVRGFNYDSPSLVGRIGLGESIELILGL